MITSEFPELCELCGEYFPDVATIFSHECPGIEALLLAHRPTLGAYQTVIEYYRKLPADSRRRRMIEWGLRTALGTDAELLDGLRRLGPRHAGRVERRLISRGLVEPPRSRRSDPAWLRRELDEMETVE